MASTQPRRCTVCRNFIKGHKGKAGKYNCTMEPMGETEDVAKPVKKNIVEVIDQKKNLEENNKQEAGGEGVVEAAPWEAGSLSPLPCEQPAHLALKRTRTEAKRIHSKSDDKIDIRTIVASKKFAICTCQLDISSDSPCECEGELFFGENFKDGAVVLDCPVFCDPLSMKTLRLDLEVDGWSPEKPNELLLNPSVFAKGIVVEGEVKLETKRAVTVVKGRKEMTVLWQLSFTDVRIGFTAAKYVMKGIKSPANLAYVTCKLYEQVEETPGMWSPRPHGAQEEVFHSLEEKEESESPSDGKSEVLGKRLMKA